jgi:hypothetical protein
MGFAVSSGGTDFARCRVRRATPIAVAHRPHLVICTANPDEQAVLIRQISGAVNGLQFRVQDLEEAVKALQERLKKP